jgi:hypothetical protein
MYTQGFGEVITDILTVNPELSGVSAASSVLDTSNYTFQAVTFGKDSGGFSNHAHTVYTSSTAAEDVPYKHLVIFAGQSNMNGVGNDDGGRDLYYRETYGRPAHNVKYWNLETSSFDNYVDPSANTTTTSKNVPIPGKEAQGVDTVYNQEGGNFGPELQFARNLEEDGIQDVYLFKFALNGSFLVDLEGTEVHKMFGRDVVPPASLSATYLGFPLWYWYFLYDSGDVAYWTQYQSSWTQDRLSIASLYLNNWNPSGGSWLGDAVKNNIYRGYSRFEDHCRAIIDTLGESTIKTVTFIWAQGEQECYQAQKLTNQYVSGYSAACSHLIDEVSAIFSGAESFNSIRSKVNIAFASGYEGSYQYYPSGFYTPVSSNDGRNNAWLFDGVYDAFALDDLNSNFPVQYYKYPRIYAAAPLDTAGAVGLPAIGPTTLTGKADFWGYTGSDGGGVGEGVTYYVRLLQDQQEAMDTAKYGPLLDFDDLSGAMLNSGSSTSFSAFSGPDLGGNGPVGIFDGADVSSYNVSSASGAFRPPDENFKTFANLNFHYNDYALTEIGRRFYGKWIELVDPPKVNFGPSSYNEDVIVVRNYSEDNAPFASSYNISSTYNNLSSSYNSIASYPSPMHRRLEYNSTLVPTVSSYETYSSMDDFGHYMNGGIGKFSDIWNVVGGFPPSSYQNWDYFILSSTDGLDSGSDIRSLTYSNGLATSGQLSGVFNADEIMDTSGYLTFNSLSDLDGDLSAVGNAVKGSAFSGGALVFSSTDNNASAGLCNVAIRLKDGDAAAVTLFGGVNHLGVWCLDLPAMLKEGLRPPFYWDNLDNIRKYKLVSKVSFWDNLMTHKDNSTQSGMDLLADSDTFEFGGPTFLLKFRFT